MNDTFVKIWVHNRESDLMMDFLLDRVSEPPHYIIDHAEVPKSITGGWIEMAITYDRYLKLRQSHDHVDTTHL
jgi:hypothetical protein